LCQLFPVLAIFQNLASMQHSMVINGTNPRF
jgi:hypothetical protein